MINKITDTYFRVKMDKDFYAGLYGGITGVCISHPIDTIRIRIQTGQNNIFGGLYKGIVPPLIGVGLEKFLVFGNYEKFKSWKLVKNQDTIIKYRTLVRTTDSAASSSRSIAAKNTVYNHWFSIKTV